MLHQQYGTSAKSRNSFTEGKQYLHMAGLTHLDTNSVSLSLSLSFFLSFLPFLSFFFLSFFLSLSLSLFSLSLCLYTCSILFGCRKKDNAIRLPLRLFSEFPSINATSRKSSLSSSFDVPPTVNTTNLERSLAAHLMQYARIICLLGCLL